MSTRFLRAVKRLLLSLAIIAALSSSSEGEARAERVDRLDEWNLMLRIDGDPGTVARELASRREGSASRRIPVELRDEPVVESLAGRHVFLREHVDGIPVLNAGFATTFALDGTITSLHDRRSRAQDATLLVTADDARRAVLDDGAPEIVGAPTLAGWLHEDGVARLAWRVFWRSGYDEWATLVDAADGRAFRTESLFFTVEARVFDPNPVTALNLPELHDNDDSADAVPDSAYTTVTILGLESEEALVGPHVMVTDFEAPTTLRAKPMSGLMFNRSQDEFEEVMVYFHLDRSQRYMQSLGFTGERTIVPYAIPVDAHGANGDDNSYYRFTNPGRGRLVFGDGGVDDAEDADIILHEYGHAIQDSIVPGGFTGLSAGEPRALGEGFGDYWAFSSTYAANVASGADAFCVGSWDARCGGGPSTRCSYPAGAACLRRVDGAKTMADFLRTGGPGTEHRNGEIWSSMLREVFLDAVALSGIEEGRRLADRTILESHFGMPPSPTYRTVAIRLLDADRRLNTGRLEHSICHAATSRGILSDDDCRMGLRGDVTMIQSPARGVAIPDNAPAGASATLTISDTRDVEAIFVTVDVRHPRRGDLRLTITSPEGASVVLQGESDDDTPALAATYGLDTPPAQPLTPFLGRSAAGTWTLTIVDNKATGEGLLLTWSLMIRFAGDVRVDERGRPGNERLHVAVSGTTAGAAGTRFVSDLRLLNPGASASGATLLFTPSGANGLEQFKALALSIAPGQVVALDDVVGAAFRASGTGSIEVRGNPGLVVTSRIYNDQPHGTFGLFLSAVATQRGVKAGDGPLHIMQLRNDAAFRSNVGLTELDGGTGEVEIRFFDESGTLVASETRPVMPYGHIQFPAFGGIGGTHVGAARAALAVTSGDARVIAYGSSIDNLSGDAVFVAGARLPRPASAIIVPAAIHAPGAAGTNWRSDLWIHNANAQAVTIDLTWHPSAGGSAIVSPLTLAASEMARLDDVVSGFFATQGTGSIAITGQGLDALLVSSRAWNDAPDGSYGQFIEGTPAESAVSAGASVRLIHLDSDATYRTNVGLTETTGAPVEARLVLVDASGSEVFSTVVALGPRENRQLSLAQIGAPETRNGQVRIDVVAGDGNILAYASVVDNRTGDAIYITPR